MPITWVQPKLVCEIKFSEWTKEKIARHPIFLGLREDKNPKDIHLEKSSTTTSMVNKKAAQKSAVTKKIATKKTSPKSDKSSVKETIQSKTSGVVLNLNDGKDKEVTIDGKAI